MPDKNIITLEHLKIETVPIDSIKPNSYNANRQSDRDFELLCRSIEEDGFTQPIIVQQDVMEIVDGEHRWRALKALKHETAEVVFVNMSDAQRMIATLRHNRARGNENFALASDVLKGLDRMGAIDHAADSLMLDQVELRVMLEDIGDVGENLRVEGEKLNVDEIKASLSEEKQRRQESARAESKQKAMETGRMQTLSLKVDDLQRILFERALKHTEGTSKGEKILNLIEMYKDEL